MTQVPPSVPPATPGPNPQPVVPVCYRHPKRETYVRCSRCDRPICPDCMNEAPVGQQCPECVNEGRHTVRTGKTTFGGTAIGMKGYATKTLIGLNILAMVVSVSTAGGKGLFGGGGLGGLIGGGTPLTQWGAVYGEDTYRLGSVIYHAPAGVADGELYRLVTNMFLHYGLLHIALNMWALWLLGRQLEGALGPIRFTILYLVSGLGGAVASYVFSPASATAGASGAIFGLFAAFFVLLRRLGRDTSAIIPMLVINLVITFAIPGISIAAHIGGLVTGGVLAVALAYPPRAIRERVAIGTVLVLLGFMTVAVYAQTLAINALPPVPGLNQ